MTLIIAQHATRSSTSASSNIRIVMFNLYDLDIKFYSNKNNRKYTNNQLRREFSDFIVPKNIVQQLSKSSIYSTSMGPYMYVCV